MGQTARLFRARNRNERPRLSHVGTWRQYYRRAFARPHRALPDR